MKSLLRPVGVGWAPHVYSVEELGMYLGMVLEGDPTLQDVWLRGEVANLSRSPAGHCYFCLKDASGQLKCVLFRGSAARSPALPQSGQAMVAHGAIRFYARQGTCELVADLVFPEGVGLAQMQFEALFRRLEAEGLFDEARKRLLPPFPRRIGLVTSEGGAVLHDVLTILTRRYPIGEVVVASTAVQGDAATGGVVRALRSLNRWRGDDGAGVDVIVLARGGGSSEDLAAFNDERVVRAIFASRAPVVSAIGHETDVTLADLAADLRAPTPSAAAELVSPDLAAIRREIVSTRQHVRQVTQQRLSRARSDARDLGEALAHRLSHRLRLAREQIAGRRAQLAALSPNATLARGYAVVEHEGRVVREAREVREGQRVAVRLRRGSLDGTVTAVHPE